MSKWSTRVTENLFSADGVQKTMICIRGRQIVLAANAVSDCAQTCSGSRDFGGAHAPAVDLGELYWQTIQHSCASLVCFNDVVDGANRQRACRTQT